MNWNKDRTSTNQTFLAAGFCKNTLKQVLTTPSTPASIKSSINRPHFPRTQSCLFQAEESLIFHHMQATPNFRSFLTPFAVLFFQFQYMKHDTTSSQFQRLTCALAPTTVAKPESGGRRISTQPSPSYDQPLLTGKVQLISVRLLL